MATSTLNDIMRAAEALRTAEDALAAAKSTKQRLQAEIDLLNTKIPGLQTAVSTAKTDFKTAAGNY